MKTVLLLPLCLLQCGCSDGSGKQRSDAQNAALKTCNKYLKPRMNADSVDIPNDTVAFNVQGDALNLRWPFTDKRKTKTGKCTTSLDGKIFRFAEALPVDR